MTTIRLLGFAYFALFVFVVALGYIPGVNDANGKMFGLFELDLYDDALHAALERAAGDHGRHRPLLGARRGRAAGPGRGGRHRPGRAARLDQVQPLSMLRR